MLLREVLGTKYLTNEYAGDLEFLVSNIANRRISKKLFTEDIYARSVKDAINKAVAEDGVIFDISDCRFTGKVWDVMARAIKDDNHISFIDSTDKERDDFLRSYASFKYEFADWERQRGFSTKPQSIEEFPDWVARLRKDVIYDLIDEEYVKNPCFVLAINILEPEIKMVLDNKSVLEYAKRVFGQYLLTDCKKFYYIYGNHHEMLEVESVDGNVHIVNIGTFDQRSFVHKYLCMPWFIGNERASLAHAPESLRKAVRDVIKDTSVFLDERPVTIETYFPLRKEYNNDD